MIKLVACDMDGTLLDSQKRLPADFPQVMTALKERGVCFAVASADNTLHFVGILKPILRI